MSDDTSTEILLRDLLTITEGSGYDPITVPPPEGMNADHRRISNSVRLSRARLSQITRKLQAVVDSGSGSVNVWIQGMGSMVTAELKCESRPFGLPVGMQAEAVEAVSDAMMDRAMDCHQAIIDLAGDDIELKTRAWATICDTLRQFGAVDSNSRHDVAMRECVAAMRAGQWYLAKTKADELIASDAAAPAIVAGVDLSNGERDRTVTATHRFDHETGKFQAVIDWNEPAAKASPEINSTAAAVAIVEAFGDGRYPILPPGRVQGSTFVIAEIGKSGGSTAKRACKLWMESRYAEAFNVATEAMRVGSGTQYGRRWKNAAAVAIVDAFGGAAIYSAATPKDIMHAMGQIMDRAKQETAEWNACALWKSGQYVKAFDSAASTMPCQLYRASSSIQADAIGQAIMLVRISMAMDSEKARGIVVGLVNARQLDGPEAVREMARVWGQVRESNAPHGTERVLMCVKDGLWARAIELADIEIDKHRGAAQ